MQTGIWSILISKGPSKGSDLLDLQRQNLTFDSYTSAVLAEDTFNGNTHARSSIEKENQYTYFLSQVTVLFTPSKHRG